MNLKTYITGPLQVNTYVLTNEDTKEAIIFDVGGSFERIKKELDEKGIEIKFILNTHGHFDHVLGEIDVQNNYKNIPIYINKEDEIHYNNLEKELEAWGFGCEMENLRPTKNIDEKTDLQFAGQKIQIFATPGHSKGSLSYYIDGKVFTGDTLFYHSIGRSDFLGGDYDTLIDSIKNKIFTLPEDTLVYPGHGPSTSIKDEKLNNPYFN